MAVSPLRITHNAAGYLIGDDFRRDVLGEARRSAEDIADPSERSVVQYHLNTLLGEQGGTMTAPITEATLRRALVHIVSGIGSVVADLFDTQRLALDPEADLESADIEILERLFTRIGTELERRSQGGAPRRETITPVVPIPDPIPDTNGAYPPPLRYLDLAIDDGALPFVSPAGVRRIAWDALNERLAVSENGGAWRPVRAPISGDALKALLALREEMDQLSDRVAQLRAGGT